MTRTVPLYFLLLAITTQSCYAFWPFTSKPAIEFEHEHVVKLTGATFEDYVSFPQNSMQSWDVITCVPEARHPTGKK